MDIFFQVHQLHRVLFLPNVSVIRPIPIPLVIMHILQRSLVIQVYLAVVHGFVLLVQLVLIFLLLLKVPTLVVHMQLVGTMAPIHHLQVVRLLVLYVIIGLEIPVIGQMPFRLHIVVVIMSF